MSRIKAYMDYLEQTYGQDVWVGGLEYGLNDVDQRIKLSKVLNSFPDLIPETFRAGSRQSWIGKDGQRKYESDTERQLREKGCL